MQKCMCMGARVHRFYACVGVVGEAGVLGKLDWGVINVELRRNGQMTNGPTGREMDEEMDGWVDGCVGG